MMVRPVLSHQPHSRALSYRQRTTKGYMMQTQAVDIMPGPRPTLALILPWYVDIIAMVVRKVE